MAQNQLERDATIWRKFHSKPLAKLRLIFDMSVQSASRNRRPARTFIDKFAVGFAIAKAQTEIAKLKRFDLKDRQARIGEAVIAEGIERPPIKHLLDRFKSCEQQVQRLDSAHKLPADAQISEKGAYVAARAKAKVQIEKIRLQQKSILVEIGEIFSRESDIPESFANDVAYSKELATQIAAKEAEVLELKTTVSSFYRHPLRVVGALIALVVIYNVWSQASAAHSRWEADRQMELSLKETEAKIKAAEAEARRIELEDRERSLKEELERKRQVERKKAEKKLREEEQQAAIQREQEAAEQRLREEALARERALIAEREALAAREASIAEEARRKEQAAQMERAQLAERLFSQIELNPTVYLSGRLMAIQSKAEAAGKDLEPFRQAKQARDWLKMLSLLNNNQHIYTSYPPEIEITSAANKLRSAKFNVILRTTFTHSLSQRLYLVRFSLTPDVIMMPYPIHYEAIYNRHPDGIGYIVKWSPSDGPMMFVADGDVGKLHEFTKEADRQLRALKTKLELGEFTPEEHLVADKDLRQRVLNAVRSWAASK